MKKIFVNMLLVIVMLTIIKITPSEQAKKIQPILERNNKNFAVFGCYGIEDNDNKNIVYVTNLKDRIEKSLEENLDSDSARIVTDYLSYDSVDWDSKKQVLIGNISQENPDDFVSLLSNLNIDENIKSKLKIICTTTDKEVLQKEIKFIQSKLRGKRDHHFFISYNSPEGWELKRVYYNKSNTSWLQKKRGKKTYTSTRLTIEHLELFDDIEQENFNKGLPLSYITKNEKKISDWLKNKRIISLKTTFDKTNPHINVAERFIFNPKKYSPIICLAIAPIISKKRVYDTQE